MGLGLVEGVEEREAQAVGETVALPEADWQPECEGEAAPDGVSEPELVRLWVGHCVGLAVGLGDSEVTVEGERCGDSVPVALSQALGEGVREGLPLSVAVGHCVAEWLGGGEGERVADTHVDAVGEAEAHCDAEREAEGEPELDAEGRAEGLPVKLMAAVVGMALRDTQPEEEVVTLGDALCEALPDSRGEALGAGEEEPEAEAAGEGLMAAL